jgi:hypothetical protein
VKPVILAPEAETEVDDALGSSRVAGDFREAIDQALATIAANPQVAAQVARSEARQYILTRFPYSIVYVEETDLIRVLALAHHRRKPGYWKSRLPRS